MLQVTRHLKNTRLATHTHTHTHTHNNKAARESTKERMRKAWQPDATVAATDDMFRADYTTTLQRLATDTKATAPDTLMRSLRGVNPPIDDDGLQYRPSPPDAPHSAHDTHGRYRLPSPPSRPRKFRARPTSTSTTRVVRRPPTPLSQASALIPSPLRGRHAFLRDNALRIVDVPADGSCGLTAVAVAMGIIQSPLFGWPSSHTHHTWDLLNQLRNLAAT
jgi:hypothetical protein